MEWHKKLSGGTIWAVGENLRFVEAVAYGAEQVKELGGDVVTFGMEMFTLIGDDDKYFNTDCEFPLYQFLHISIAVLTGLFRAQNP